MNSTKLWFLFAGFLIALGDLNLAVAFYLFAIGAIPIVEHLGVIPGYVYIIRSGKLYKIGVTTGDVERRIDQLQTGASSKLSLVHSIPAWRPFNLESQLHEQYASKRKRGEWFELSNYDVRKLKLL